MFAITSLAKRLIRIERHTLGPRVHIAGRRIHEWHAGAALIAGAALAAAFSVRLPLHAVTASAVLGTYLVAKDWRDLLPRTRDTGAWRIGLHRPPLTLRPAPRGDWLPTLSAALAAAVGMLNVVAATATELPARLRAVSLGAPQELMIGAHALTLPAGLALVGAAIFLQRKRRRAQRVAVALLAALGAVSLLRGFDVLEAAMSWSVAALLIWGRAAFRVTHDAAAWPATLRRFGAALAGLLVIGVTFVAASAHWASPEPTAWLTLREAIGLLTLTGGPMSLAGPASWVPAALGTLGTTAAALGAWFLLRPTAAPAACCAMPDRAATIVRAHGRDTLSYFKLREDLARHFSADGTAFVAYRVEHGTLVLAGDPVGPPEALPGLLADVCRFADARGLKVGAVGAGDEFASLSQDAGLRRFYVGDEAIVETASFSLEGKPIKKVRQATHRLRKAGYTVDAHRLDELSPAEFAQLEALSDRWRDGAPERGFSMAMDSLRNPMAAETLVVVAYDADGAPRGFLHFVPSFGRPALSLSLMRRDRDTPNGLIDFLIVRAIELARDRGIAEVSLNFAAFARLLHSPSSRRDRLLGRLIRVANPYFQIESLYSFNAKFMPRWEPRYLLYDGALGLPRTALAVLRTEGQLPSPRWLGRRRPAPPLVGLGLPATAGP